MDEWKKMTSHDPTAVGEQTPPGLPRAFTFVLATSAAEGFGDMLACTLLPILAVSVLGLGTGFVGLLNSIGLAAFLLLGMPVGMLIDRLRNRRRGMGVATVARCLVLAGLTSSYYAGWLSGATVIGATVVIGLADVAFTTAQGTVIPSVVQTERLKSAYSRLAVVNQTASTAAAATGSLALGFLGMPGMMWASVCSYAESALLQRGIKIDSSLATRGPARRGIGRFRDGFQALHRIPALWALTLSAALTNAGAMLGNTVLPVFLLRDLGIAPAAFAGLGVVSAIGAIIGAAFAPRLSARFGLKTLRSAAAILSVPAVAMAIACQQLPGHELIWLSAQSLAWSFLVSISAVAGAEVLPRSVPSEELATVGSAQRTIALGIMPIAALLGGAVAVLTGPVPLLCVWALLAGAAALPIVRAHSLKTYR
ncbi:MFS transporter [Paeniglutamicibacter sp. MACA_103]|uniref:MFS transporter n=1 Tax=Paeniglutamicibacter sp. MACA_103 TaxID=3377337 RepID=UPI003894E429